jgi:single-strand DNA-binding protein
VDWDVRNVNSVVVIGNVGMTPEITEFGNGACVARCSLAVRGKKKAAGSMDGGFMDDSQQDSQEDDAQTTWLDVEAWNDEARQLVEHVAKGRQLQVTGRLKENTWIDKATGQKRSRIKVSAYAFAPPPAAAAQSQNYAAPATYGAPSAAAAPQAGGEKDDLWRDCVENPDAWWDNRSRKAEPGGNPRYPDFKHKESQTPLWIESRDTPAWAAEALANGGAVAPDPGFAAAAAAAPAAAGGGDGFDPYYAADAAPAGPGAGTAYEPDYSQPYAPEAGGYEPAKPFPEEDEPPF